GAPERIRRAHGGVAMFRTALFFCAALGKRDCEQLVERLSHVKFEKAGSRDQEMTFVQAQAFIAKAHELGERGDIPMMRARYMAVGVAAQFDLLLRQKDIIGE